MPKERRADASLIRDLAIIMVDGPLGYTMEFSSNPAAHAEEYNAMENLLLSGLEHNRVKLATT